MGVTADAPLKRRLSLSEVLNSQKRMRPAQQTVRPHFGGGHVSRANLVAPKQQRMAGGGLMFKELKPEDDDPEEEFQVRPRVVIWYLKDSFCKA